MKRADEIERGVRVARVGHGANCSSIGSVIDTLFATAVVGGALFAAISAALAREEVTRVAPSATPARSPAEDDAKGDAP
jgi:hypothetical protein